MTLPTAHLPPRVHQLERRSDIGKRILIVIAVLFATIILIGNATILVLIRHQQVQSVKTNTQTNQLTHAVLSCTQPEGKCFKRGQARTADAVASINQITIYAVSCAQDDRVPNTRIAISACVTRLIKEHR